MHGVPFRQVLARTVELSGRQRRPAVSCRCTLLVLPSANDIAVELSWNDAVWKLPRVAAPRAPVAPSWRSRSGQPARRARARGVGGDAARSPRYPARSWRSASAVAGGLAARAARALARRRWLAPPLSQSTYACAGRRGGRRRRDRDRGTRPPAFGHCSASMSSAKTGVRVQKRDGVRAAARGFALLGSGPWATSISTYRD